MPYFTLWGVVRETIKDPESLPAWRLPLLIDECHRHGWKRSEWRLLEIERSEVLARIGFHKERDTA